MKEEKIILLIHKVISGNASEQESFIYNKWLNESAENKDFAMEISDIWEKSANITKDDFKLDKNKIKSNIFSKIAKEQNFGNTLNKRHSRIIRLNSVASVAAVFLVVIGAFFIIKNSLYSNKKIIAKEEISLVTLPDNSSVWLKKNSELEINRNFNDSNRKLKLTGSAFFDIFPNKNTPFIISVEECKVKILGTSFDIITNENHDIIVNVYSGTVRFFKPDNSYLEVSRTQSLKYLRDSNKIVIRQLKSKSSRLKSGYLSFINENLDVVFEKLSKYYNINFDFQCEGLNKLHGFTSQGIPTLKVEDYFKSIKKLYPIEIIKVDENDFKVKCLN